MDTNVGDMPLEIFADYTADCLGMDFPWEYLVPLIYDMPEPYPTHPSTGNEFRRISIPLVRRIFPQLVASAVVTVQLMSSTV